jgi:hypothetical protein
MSSLSAARMHINNNFKAHIQQLNFQLILSWRFSARLFLSPLLFRHVIYKRGLTPKQTAHSSKSE